MRKNLWSCCAITKQPLDGLYDIKGISPSMCMHHILFEDNVKPIRKIQRRLNPLMMEVVKAKILKLLDAGDITPSRTVNGWRQSMWCLKRPESHWWRTKMMNSSLLTSRVVGECVLIIERLIFLHAKIISHYYS
jgi:hypothetical protein